MGIEGQFREITNRTGRQLAPAGNEAGKNYFSSIRRFPVLER